MDHSDTVRIQTEALCLDIGRLEQKLVAKTIAFEDAEQRWNETYQPKARALAESMLSYVPSSDPSIFVEFETGGSRALKSNAIICIEAPLHEGSAPAHLSTVTKLLRNLANYLPIQVATLTQHSI